MFENKRISNLKKKIVKVVTLYLFFVLQYNFHSLIPKFELKCFMYFTLVPSS